MRRNFCKLHSAGNDFILLDNTQASQINAAECRILADRHFGIGCDQIIIFKLKNNNDDNMSVITLNFFNADGTKADACGNGTCCAAWWHMHENGLMNARFIVGDKKFFSWYIDNEVWVNMGTANFSYLPINYDSLFFINSSFLKLPLQIAILVAMPNPHLVLILSSPADDELVTQYGPYLETHPVFDKRYNIEFVWSDGEFWHVRVWERGVGETLACGSGACASFAALKHTGMICDNHLIVHFLGGALSVKMQRDNTIALSSPVKLVFSGKWYG